MGGASARHGKSRGAGGSLIVVASAVATLTLLFVLLQAPDVALSQVAVGTAVVPLMVLLAVRKVRGGKR